MTEIKQFIKDCKVSKYYILVIMLLILVNGCAQHHCHPFHIQNVTNFARKIDDQSGQIIEKEWTNVLKRQPITTGKTKPTYAAIIMAQENCNKKAFKRVPEWPTSNEFAAAAAGDCKGFAICKYYALRKAGFSASQLNLWSGDYDGVPHLILVARLNDKQYVLDIMEPNLPEAKDYFYKHFQPAYRFNENGWDVN